MARLDHLADDEDDEEDDKLPDTTAQKFMRLLEQEMLNGRGEVRLREWAVNLGVPNDSFSKMYAAIKLSWKQPQLSVDSFIEQRDLAHARYLSIYRKAMKIGHLSTAVKAVSCIVDLIGLAQPAQMEISLGEGSAAQKTITNSARDNVARLVEKMKARAADQGSTSAKVDNAMMLLEEKIANGGRVIDVPAETTNGVTNGHSNGHSSVIENDEDDDGGS